MLETEKYLDSVLVECVHRTSFDPRDFFPKFVDTNAPDQESYQQRRNVVNALGFLENKRLISGEMKVEFTPNLRLASEVRHGAPTKFGQFVARVPRFLRLGLFCVLLQWKRLVALLGALASVKLLHNAYLGAVLLVGWIEYVVIFVLAWIAYLLIRRALD